MIHGEEIFEEMFEEKYDFFATIFEYLIKDYNKDSGGKSMCNDDCAKNWPPLMATPSDKAEGKWSTVKRDDGTMQWAYDGKPLYTFVKDKAPGDMTGDKMKDVWHVIHESQK